MKPFNSLKKPTRTRKKTKAKSGGAGHCICSACGDEASAPVTATHRHCKSSQKGVWKAA